jgi:hypothetical protein
MSGRPTYTVACLSGHGIGPEVMAEASRALGRVSQLHGFRIEELHPPFAGEAVTQSGHALPAATRTATLAADAILVAAAHEPAVAGVESELDLHARSDRIAFGARGVVTVLSPLGDDALAWSRSGETRSGPGASGWKRPCATASTPRSSRSAQRPTTWHSSRSGSTWSWRPSRWRRRSSR